MIELGKTLNFSTAQVLVVGDIMLDRNWIGATQRISPEAPVPVVNIQTKTAHPGGAANVAMNIAALGGQVTLCGIIGDDEAGNLLDAILEQHCIKRLFLRSEEPTITKLRIISRHQQLIRLDFEQKYAEQHSKALISIAEEALAAHNVVVFSDYGKGALQSVNALIPQAKAQGKTVLVDPKGNDFARYAGADIVTPNMAELAHVVGPVTDNTLVEKARQCLQENNIQALLITRSEKGMTYVTKDSVEHFPAQARDVFDVTGAGDTVVAALAAALSANYETKEAMLLAQCAASVVVGKLGTATLSIAELRQALLSEKSLVQCIVKPKELLMHVAQLKKRGRTVVMTNGCFDIVHAGHVAYLEEARALGDCLIVAVNSDASVRRLKGEDRPANSLESRLHVLAALRSVDWVVAFDDDTPEALIQAISPNILVKGGDNRIENIPGAQWVLEHGGEVRILSYKAGFSTTQTLSKYRNQAESDTSGMASVLTDNWLL